MTITIRIDDVVDALAFVMDQYDKGSEKHAQRVAALAMSLGHEVGLSDEEMTTLRRAALIHDVGKIAIGVNILNKAARLTDVEMDAVRQHPEYGYQFGKKFNLPEELLQVIICHHEYIDGSGYPRGIRGEEIPRLARMITLADQYDALTQPRPNRAAYSHPLALSIMQEMKSRYDEFLFETFMRLHNHDVKDK